MCDLSCSVMSDSLRPHGLHQGPLSLLSYMLHSILEHVLFNFRTCKKAKDRGALIEEKTNHCLLRINLNSYPIISEQS